jgi:hypothetical protein
MSEPGGSGRIQQDVPTASGSGDNSDLATDPDEAGSGTHDGVPLTRDAALERDRSTSGEQPAREGTQPELADHVRSGGDE